MLFDDTYKTVEISSEGIFRAKGSKFISYIFPLSSETELKELLIKVKELHPKASHHCWALRLSPDRSVFRLSDDGEPSGTAGRPILNTLLSRDITNVLVVVVRYFGGTLLGVAGLIDAYKNAALEAINGAVVVEATISSIYLISFDHLEMNDVMRVIKDEGLKIIDQVFDSVCQIRISIRQSAQERVVGRFKKVKIISLKYISTN